MIQDKVFREDLYYRLNVVPLTIPPLRERKEDILALIVSYLNHFNKKYGTGKSFAPQTIDYLLKYNWPGNVRELINTLERLAVTVVDELILPEDLPQVIVGKNGEVFYETVQSLTQAVASLEKNMIIKALQEHKSTRKAAKALFISQSALMKKAAKYGIKYEKQWDAVN